MVVVLRYMTLLALGLVSILAFISASYATAYGLFQNNAYAVATNGYLGMMFGVVLVVVTWLAVRRFSNTVAISSSSDFVARHKENIFTIGLVCLIGAFFVVL